jgi:chromatin segregation and condensation protein Rec8/ScpA/Scc1 (kleisin family)
MHDKVHGESLSEDLQFTWDRLREHGGEAVPLSAIWGHDPWERVTIFVSLLFLAKFEKVRITQDDPMRGEILIQPTVEGSEVEIEELATEATEGVA